ncbi:Mutyh [Scenedesmus sp. PABB004]|nr:Mutyh [Scenedesmus sp. PABB004]
MGKPAAGRPRPAEGGGGLGQRSIAAAFGAAAAAKRCPAAAPPSLGPGPAPADTSPASDQAADAPDEQAAPPVPKPAPKRAAAAKPRGAAKKPRAAARPPARAAAAADSDASSDGGGGSGSDAEEGAVSDGEGAGAEAAAAAAAAAADFSDAEVAQVHAALLSWYDRVHRVLPWRRNPHSTRPDGGVPAAAAAAAADGAGADGAGAAAAAAGGGKAGGGGKKARAPTKKELAAAEAEAVLAGAAPAPADLPPQAFAYRVWVSEVMLQQTQVARVVGYFKRWIAAWPTVADLAAATQEQVNEVWAGLGYYRRARYLRDGASHVVSALGGRFPETAAEMRSIPGVGPYTAAAVASIAFGDAAAAVDGNVIRVLSRLRALRGNPAKRPLAAAWDRLAARLLHPDRPGCHNQAMMELGATVCRPANPACGACPLSGVCAARAAVDAWAAGGGAADIEDAPRVTDYPEKVAKAAKAEQHVAVCVVKALLLPGADTAAALDAAAAAAAGAAARGGGAAKAAAARAAGGAAARGSIRSFLAPAPPAGGGAAAASEDDLLAAGAAPHYLLVQRPQDGLLAGLWELPGAALGAEPAAPAARRAAADALLTRRLGVALPPGGGGGGGGGVRVVRRRALGASVHVFSHIRQTSHAEELVLLAPSLDAVLPPAGGGDGASAGDARPPTRWVSAAELAGAGLTSGVRKILALAANGKPSLSAPPPRGAMARARLSATPLGAGLALLLAAALVRRAEAHGFLLDPPSRNWKAYKSDRYDWAHGVNSGGKYKVSDNCRLTWPNGQHGLCGDVAGESRWMAPTPPSSFKAGDIIKLQVLVQTNHAGRFDFSLCPPDAKEDKQCTRLERADGRGQYWYLPRVRSFNGGATGDAAVPTERGPIATWSWLVMPHTDCGAGKYCDQFMGNTVYEVRYRLPAGFTCDRCILQWHWLTGHSCWPPCTKEDPTFPNCAAPTYPLPACGSPGASYPEEFWNCADVRITKQ